MGKPYRLVDRLLNWGWRDKTMRWHLIGALVASVGLTGLSLGMNGYLPVALTVFLSHPGTAVASLVALDRAPLGDNGWPFFILSGLSWPWAFPMAWGLVARWRKGFRRNFAYALIVAVWWTAQSFLFSRLFFGRNIFQSSGAGADGVPKVVEGRPGIPRERGQIVDCRLSLRAILRIQIDI